MDTHQMYVQRACYLEGKTMLRVITPVLWKVNIDLGATGCVSVHVKREINDIVQS